MTPLTELREGQIGTVREIQGGRSVTQRLASVGIIPGVQLSVQRNRGPMVVRIRSDRLILGKRVAARVMVSRPHPPAQPSDRKTA